MRGQYSLGEYEVRPIPGAYEPIPYFFSLR
jgi:hypothetical protein